MPKKSNIPDSYVLSMKRCGYSDSRIEEYWARTEWGDFITGDILFIPDMDVMPPLTADVVRGLRTSKKLSLSKYVGKGSLIGVGGELTNWTDKEGHTRIGLIARTTEYLALKRREAEEPSLDFEY